MSRRFCWATVRRSATPHRAIPAQRVVGLVPSADDTVESVSRDADGPAGAALRAHRRDARRRDHHDDHHGRLRGRGVPARRRRGWRAAPFTTGTVGLVRRRPAAGHRRHLQRDLDGLRRRDRHALRCVLGVPRHVRGERARRVLAGAQDAVALRAGATTTSRARLAPSPPASRAQHHRAAGALGPGDDGFALGHRRPTGCTPPARQRRAPTRSRCRLAPGPPDDGVRHRVAGQRRHDLGDVVRDHPTGEPVDLAFAQSDGSSSRSTARPSGRGLGSRGRASPAPSTYSRWCRARWVRPTST